jgi:hypothetical protein
MGPSSPRWLALGAGVLGLGLGLVACGGGDDGDPAADPDATAVDARVVPIDAPVTTDAATDGASTLPRFSFFVTSVRAIRELSGNQQGFGGDLRFGETGAGAGLRGADKICATIADRSMPGSSAKGWRAFLSAASDGNGNVVNAIDRIGNGPWYDRLGRLLASSKANLLADRPVDADTTIKNDFPNEDGVPNHNPDGTGQVDNHDMLTGTTRQGTLRLSSQTGRPQTCLDWTAKTGNTGVEDSPRVGHSWPRQGSGVNWMEALTETGCAPGINLIETGGPLPPTSDPAHYDRNTVGSGGGYGGFYCFALMP